MMMTIALVEAKSAGILFVNEFALRCEINVVFVCKTLFIRKSRLPISQVEVANSARLCDLVVLRQDGDQGEDDMDDDGPGEADLEGRVEKYIGVKAKACIFHIPLLHFF